MRRLTGGRGVQVVYDGVGRATFDKSLALPRAARAAGPLRPGQRPVPPFDPQATGPEGLALPHAAHALPLHRDARPSCSRARTTSWAGWREGSCACASSASYPLRRGRRGAPRARRPRDHRQGAADPVTPRRPSEARYEAELPEGALDGSIEGLDVIDLDHRETEDVDAQAHAPTLETDSVPAPKSFGIVPVLQAAPAVEEERALHGERPEVAARRRRARAAGSAARRSRSAAANPRCDRGSGSWPSVLALVVAERVDVVAAHEALDSRGRACRSRRVALGVRHSARRRAHGAASVKGRMGITYCRTSAEQRAVGERAGRPHPPRAGSDRPTSGLVAPKTRGVVDQGQRALRQVQRRRRGGSSRLVVVDVVARVSRTMRSGSPARRTRGGSRR